MKNNIVRTSLKLSTSLHTSTVEKRYYYTRRLSTRTADEGVLDCVKDREGLPYTSQAFKSLKAPYKFLWHQKLHKENISCSI